MTKIKEINQLEYASSLTKLHKLPVQLDDGTILQANVGDIVNLALSDVDDTIVQTISYNDLAELKSGNGLKAGNFYKIEYITKHVIPNTDVIYTGTPENIILFATSVNTFDKRALSVDIPTDDIDYDFDDNLCEDTTTARPGFITRRKDNITNNEVVGFDFKNCKFRRYKVEWDSIIDEFQADTNYTKGKPLKYLNDIYVSIQATTGQKIDNANYFVKLFSCDDYVCLTTGFDTKIYVNNIEVAFKGNSYFYSDNYLFDYTNADNINNYVKCTVVNNNTISGYFSNNTISGYFSNNTISGYLYNNTISGEFYNNTISVEFYDNTISGYFYNNTISGNFSINTISKNFSINTISGEFYINTISGNFSINTISGSFRYNQILTSVENVDFTLSTFVYNNFNKTIGLNSLDVLYISYVDGDNVQQIVNITD